MIYEVQAGDSPAKIAIRYAGCPKCAIDLVLANPHKPAVQYPNGFRTFRELIAGEQLVLPDKWFNGEHDARPPEYFARLPYADGVTRGRLGQTTTPAAPASQPDTAPAKSGHGVAAVVGLGLLSVTTTVIGIAVCRRACKGKARRR